jgi:hypothetical protein
MLGRKGEFRGGLELAFNIEVSESLGVIPPWNLDSLDSILRRSS